MFGDPQILAREMVVDVEHPTLGHMKALGTPIKMSGTPIDPHRRAPLLGEHTREVLAAIGVSDDEFARLVDAGVVQ